ncbi:MAG: hypothetical protein RIC55_34900 [Pirellulaceae bacterium]
MSDGMQETNRILRPLLEAAQRAGGEEAFDDEQLLDDETLARFAEGDLEPEELAGVLDHLDRHAASREAAARLLTVENGATSGDAAAETAGRIRTASKTPAAWRGPSYRVMLASVAALLLVLVGLVIVMSRPEDPAVAESRAFERASRLVEQHEYDAARDVLAAAREAGVVSTRLSNLQARALLKTDQPLLLASAGGLPDYGYQIGGVAARSAASDQRRQQLASALELLPANSADYETRMNRGCVLLQLDRPAEALVEFQAADGIRADGSAAALGRGLALFMLERFAEAEQQFRDVSAKSSRLAEALINLAMSLEEQGKYEQALAAWERVPLDSLSPQRREQVEAVIQEVREALQS